MCTYKQIVKEQKRMILHLNQKQDVSRHLVLFLVEVNGFEPMTSCVQGRRSPS